MSFHISNYGNFGQGLRCFADQNGYVPEKGDKPEDFQFGHDEFTEDFDGQGNGYEGFAADQWSTFVAEAVEATQVASDALEEWRERSA